VAPSGLAEGIELAHGAREARGGLALLEHRGIVTIDDGLGVGELRADLLRRGDGVTVEQIAPMLATRERHGELGTFGSRSHHVPLPHAAGVQADRRAAHRHGERAIVSVRPVAPARQGRLSPRRSACCST
jgi:hypothetical protein